jgi:hypothetical protein
MDKNNKIFDLNELPSAYFKDNKNSKELRNKLLENDISNLFGTSLACSGKNELENLFFSEENIIKINKKLILTVYNKSNKKYKINPQSHESLLIVMRFVFIEYGRNLPYNIEKQIADLNCIVVGEILPNIFTNITQKIEYLRFIESDRELLDLPTSVNKKNLLPSISNIYF